MNRLMQLAIFHSYMIKKQEHEIMLRFLMDLVINKPLFEAGILLRTEVERERENRTEEKRRINFLFPCCLDVQRSSLYIDQSKSLTT